MIYFTLEHDRWVCGGNFIQKKGSKCPWCEISFYASALKSTFPVDKGINGSRVGWSIKYIIFIDEAINRALNFG